MSDSKHSHCRFCAELKPDNEIIDLKADLVVRNEITEKLTFLNVEYVDFSNTILPETLCTSCHKSLNATHEFITKIKISQEILSDLNLNTFKIEFNVDYNHEFKETNVLIKLENLQEDSNSESLYKTFACEKTQLETKTELCITTLTSEGFSSSDNEDKETEDGSKLNISWYSYPWLCSMCKMRFNSINDLREHCKESHGTCYGFQCVDCASDIVNFNEFVEHVRLHRAGLNYFCQYCNVKLEAGQPSDHISTHTSQPNCPTCGEIFTNETSLQSHINQYCYRCEDRNKCASPACKELLSQEVKIDQPSDVRIESWLEYPQVCLYCNMQFYKQETLTSHVKKVHRKCFGMKCVDCAVDVDTVDAFVDHVQLHWASLRYYCLYCNHKFDSIQSCTEHVAEHVNRANRCNVCGEVFSDKDELEKHTYAYNPPKRKRSRVPKRKNVKKRGTPLTIDDLTCKVCQKVLKSLNSLYIHRKLHTDRHRDYTCDRCGQAFYAKSSLLAHNKIHDNPEPQVCKICKKSFLTLTRLKKHVTTHFGVKPFQCNECPKSFRLKEQLKDHTIIHTDLTPFQCQYCDKAFKQKSVLKTHENQHTGARPYSCEICSRDFASWSNCDKHMKRKHGITYAKNVLTPQGKLPINPKTGKPKKVKDLETVKDWTEQIMVPRKRGKKAGDEGTSYV